MTPTEEQLADFFTKPLGAPAFKRHRDIIMGDEKLQLHFGRLDPPKMTESELSEVADAYAEQKKKQKRKGGPRRH